MTSLQQQLQKLKKPQTSIYNEVQHFESILYDVKEGQSYSRDAFFEIGVSGFTNLLELESEFCKFQHLFDPKFKNMQRFVTDAATNKILNDSIEDFLYTLTPYMMLQSSLKVLEWLIQRYAIHEMNVDAVMKCIMPYYDQAVFCNVLKVLNIRRCGRSGEQNLWMWLSPLQEAGVRLNNEVLARQWAHSKAFRTFCNSYIKKLPTIYKRESDAKPGINFYFIVVWHGLSYAAKSNKQDETDDGIQGVLQILHILLKAKFNEMAAVGLILVMKLALTSNLDHLIWQDVICLVLKSARDSELELLTGSLLTICQEQRLTALSGAVLHQLHLPQSPVLEYLASRPTNSRIACFLIAYAGGCVREATGKDTHALLLQRLTFVTKFQLKKGQAKSLIRHVISSAGSDSADWLPAALSALETAFPDGYDSAIQYLNNSSDEISDVTRKILSARSAPKDQEMLDADVKPPAVVAVTQLQAMLRQLQTTVASERDVAPELLLQLVSAASDAVLEFGLLSRKVNPSGPWSAVAAEHNALSWNVVVTVAMAAIPHLRPLHDPHRCSLAFTQVPAVASASTEQVQVQLYVHLLHLLLYRPNKATQLLEQLVTAMGDTMSVVRLLSLVFGWQPQSSLVSIRVQTACVELVTTLLKDSNDTDLASKMCSTAEPVILSALSALTIDHQDDAKQEALSTAVVALLKIILDLGKPGSELRALMRLFANEGHSTAQQLMGLVSHACSTGGKVLQSLSSFLSQPEQPHHLVGIVLFLLSRVEDKSILKSVLPTLKDQLEKLAASSPPAVLDRGSSMLVYWSLQHVNTSSVSLLGTKVGWRVFQLALECGAEVISFDDGVLLSPQAIIADQVVQHKLVLEVNSANLSGRLWAEMARIASQLSSGGLPRDVSRLQRALRASSLHARFVLDQINALQLGPKATNIQAAHAKRVKIDKVKSRKRVSSDEKKPSNTEATELPPSWTSLKMLLELLCEVKDIQEPWLLVEPLCNCMHEALALGVKLTARILQQILTTLHHLIKLAIANPPVDKELRGVLQLNVELMVKCVRQYPDPSTHRQVLTILAMTADILPDALLHNLTTIFTFMGEGLLQRDDQFSFQVIEESIKTLVPLLVRGNRNNKTVVSVVQVFVDNLPDIPQHRRLIVFNLLTQSLSSDAQLWLVNLLIIKSYVMRNKPLRLHHEELPGTRGENRRTKEMPLEVNFALQLTNKMPVRDQINAARTILSLVTSVPTAIGAGYEPNWECVNPLAAVLGLPSLVGKQLRHFLYVSVGYLYHLFNSESFIAAVAPDSDNPGKIPELLPAYEDLLTSTSAYLNTVMELEKSTLGEDAIANRFWSSLQCKVADLLDSICVLLPPSLLICVTKQLLSSPLPSVRKKSLELLKARLLPSAAFFDSSHSDEIQPLLEDINILASSSSEKEDIRQVSLGAVQFLLRFLSPSLKLEDVMPILNSSVSLLKNSSQFLVMQSLLVVAECVGIMRHESISVLSDLLPPLLQYLNPPSATDLIQDHLLLSAVAVLYKVLEFIPQFLSPWVEELVVRLCRLACHVIPGKESGFVNKINSLVTLLIEKIQPRVLLPAMLAAYKQLTDSKELLCVRGILEMTERLVGHMDRREILQHNLQALEILKEALQARHSYSDSVSASTVEAVESAAVSAVLRLVMRQDEDSNISMLSTLQQWADSRGSTHSRISFYRVLDRLVRTLRVLFIKAGLADHIFNHSVTTLSNSNKLSIKKMKRQALQPDTSLELKYVLSFLTELFKHDSTGFISETRFNEISEQLVDLITNTAGGLNAYKERAVEQLQPCLLSLCSTTRNDALWSKVNNRMLQLLRKDLPVEVHVAVLSINQSLVEEFGEDWLLPLLTDSLTFITEALESSNAPIEDQARSLLNTMEELSGDAVKEQLEV